jgi:hypothetical protein
MAPRCAHCDGRALLDRETADALVAGADGQLEVYQCPVSDGWHVWAPNSERPSRRR